MSRPRKKMSEIRKIIQTRLLSPDLSERQIALACNASRPTVSRYLKYLENNPLTIEELKGMSSKALEKHLGFEASPISQTGANRLLSQWLNNNAHRLSQKHMTRRLLHEEYVSEIPEPLKYSQFCFILQQKTQKPLISGMLSHKAGDKLYLDFTGTKFKWNDESGESHVEEVFVATNGASSRFYAQPVANQKQETFAWATEKAFIHFGGVPNAVVTDCLKSAVIKNDGYEPEHNRLFERLLEHYGAVNIPARPYRPKDKAVVESTVNIVYRRIFKKLEGKTYPHRQAMLDAWMATLLKVNQEPFQKLPGSRMSRFEELDKPAMKPLPKTLFPLKKVLKQKINRKLFVYLSDDRTSYSVPHSLHGRHVEVLISTDTIEIWYDNLCFATHERKSGAGKVINSDHLPENQKWYETRNLDESLRSAENYGIHVKSWAAKQIKCQPHPDIAIRIISGLLALAKKYPERIDTACRIGLKTDPPALRQLRQIIKSGEDLVVTEAEHLTFSLPFHENVRGPEYYSGEVV